MKIIYEDNHLLVVEKPPGIASQADRTGDPDMLGLLKQYVKEKYRKPGDVYLGLVHRLDRPVGGVMVFARTSKAASRLSEQVRTRKISKTYLAVVSGIPAPSVGRLVHHLLKDAATNTVRAVEAGTPGAREAALEYRLVDSREGLGLLAIRLLTGRPHQIRVQLSAAGHPLLGDQKYGNEKYGSEKYGSRAVSADETGGMAVPHATVADPALWSVRLVLTHPVKNETMVFDSRPPDVFPWTLFDADKEKGWTNCN